MKYEEISQHAMERMEPFGHAEFFPAGHPIYFQNEDSPDFYIVKKGRVRAFLMSQSGKDLTIEIIPEGRIFGESSFLSRSARMTSMEAVTDAVVLHLSMDSIVAMVHKEPDLVVPLMEMMAGTISNLSHQVRRLGFMNAAQKTADYLVSMTDHPHKSLEIQETMLPYSHDEIARALSLQRVTVSRILKDFESRGWVKLEYKKVLLLDRTALKEFALEDQ